MTIEHQASPYVPGEYAEGDGGSCAVCGEPIQFILGTWEHESSSNDIPDHAHVDYGQACRHGCYEYCGTCS